MHDAKARPEAKDASVTKAKARPHLLQGQERPAVDATLTEVTEQERDTHRGELLR